MNLFLAGMIAVVLAVELSIGRMGPAITSSLLIGLFLFLDYLETSQERRITKTCDVILRGKLRESEIRAALDELMESK